MHIKEMGLMDVVFESLRDESAQVRKLALSILTQVLVKFNQHDSLDVQDLTKYFKK